MKFNAVEQHEANFSRKAEAKACASYLMHLRSHRSVGRMGTFMETIERQRDALPPVREP